jgi:GNAT superfamily N-acetyltransferase
MAGEHGRAVVARVAAGLHYSGSLSLQGTPMAPPDESVSIRKAQARDADAIAAFNRAMALETEGKALIPELVAAGVRRLLEEPALGFYAVAEHGHHVVGCLMVTNEWSDWRNGLFWWIQSVYVERGWRRRGVYRRLYDFIRELARSEPGICGFRLYVEKENAVAQRTYAALGMAATDYLMYEELKPGVRYFEDPPPA